MKIIKFRQRSKQVFAKFYTFLIKSEFYSLGRSKIYPSVKIMGARHIEIGNNVIVQENSWLYALPEEKGYKPIIIINDDVYLGHQLHLTAINTVIIEKNVLIADRVYISDNIHNYEDINKPIKDQGVSYKGEVIISENCWIGENVCIIGASVGKNSVVSANAVVTRNIPPFCVAAGIPARIIKKYDFDTKKWRATNRNGEFLNG